MKKAPSTKHQAPEKHQAPSLKESAAEIASQWWDDEHVEEPMVFKDGPNNDSPGRHPFDLEERTAIFGEKVVRFSRKIPRHPTNDRLIDQLVGCGTSVGANYREANEGVSKKDFRHPISRCAKEAKETKF